MPAATIRHVLIAMSALGCATLSAAPSAGKCRVASGFSEGWRRDLIPIATGTDSVSVHFRSIYKLAKVDSAAQVVHVTDRTICRRAADALGALHQPPGNHTDYPLGVWVLALGPTRYVVFDGRQHAAGSLHLVVFDQQFNQIGLIR